MKLIEKYLKRFIEKHYDFWGTKIETDLPPEFIILEHAFDRLDGRFPCGPDKYHKVMLKAWESQEPIDRKFLQYARAKHQYGIYKLFHGYVFVFRTRYNKKLGCAQKYLVTVFKKNGYQVYS